jgi:SP family facilitated glucose transporter-like MFS transporter 2
VLLNRKKSILMINVLVIISGALTVLSELVTSYVPFIIGRFFTGIYCGLFTGLGPLYLSEISPKNLRGAAGTMHQLSLVIGILATNIMGLPEVFGKIDRWPYLVGFTIVPSLVHFIFFPFCVETPKFVYISQNNPKKAEISKNLFLN